MVCLSVSLPIIDDKFQTVASLPKGLTLRDEWLNILTFNHDCFHDHDPGEDVDTNNVDTTLPMLPHEFTNWMQPPPLTPTPHPTPPVIYNNDTTIEVVDQMQHTTPGGVTDVPEGDIDAVPEGDNEALPSDDVVPHTQTTRRNPSRNVGTYKDGPAKLRSCPIDGEEYDFTFTLDEDPPVAFLARRGLTHTQPLPQKLSKADILECHLLQHNWVYSRTHHPHFHLDIDSHTYVDVVSDPRVLETSVMTCKSSKYDNDNPSYDMAMNGPFQGEYYEAMRAELKTIADDFGCWEVVPRNPGMNVLPSPWAFTEKRFPDGSIKKFKARFCAHGDRQLEGIDYFETWAPVIQWSTIQIVLILSLKLGWVSAQCDITAAFIHALLPADEEIYVEQPRGFRTHKGHVLRLRRSLYGLKQAPRHFFHYLTERLLKQGLQQSIHDPCLFFTSSLIVVVYVDDLLIFSQSDDLIDTFITSMQREEICLQKEGTAEGYLGVDIKTIDGKIHLTQSGLSERILKALGFDKHSTSCKTPAEAAPLPNDESGDPASGTINYASIVGMLLYLSGHTRPDLAFAVHQCARYTFAPTTKHERALLRIGRYLKGTVDKGIIITPCNALHLDCYPDANFVGLWNHENANDPHCVRSRTGYVITLAQCPILWACPLNNGSRIHRHEHGLSRLVPPHG